MPARLVELAPSNDAKAELFVVDPQTGVGLGAIEAQQVAPERPPPERQPS
jgi:hypothetical protein